MQHDDMKLLNTWLPEPLGPVQGSKFIVPHAEQVHLVFRAGGGGGGNSLPGMPKTLDKVREKSPQWCLGMTL